ncbi:MAG: hypothetical protein LC790_04510, partial [Actinobacteria bacterium]|nr:hypothetical protein [Actinomycetota bacterium]
ELTRDLREMSDALRRNSERLLQDVRAAHARLTASLDHTVGAAPAPRRGLSGGGTADDLEVPEFVPGGRRDA